MLGIRIDKTSGVPFYLQVRDELRAAIVEGRVQADEKLPAERELARRLKVNRLTVSRGYEALRKERMLLRRRGSGTFVAPNVSALLGEDAPVRLRTVALTTRDESKALPRSESFILGQILQGVHEVFGDRSVKLKLIPDTRLSLDELRKLDGVLLMDRRGMPRETAAAICGDAVPAVQTWYPSRFPNVPLAARSSLGCARRATEHLVACGYRRIGFLGDGFGPRGDMVAKLQAFVQVMFEGGLDVLSRDLIPASVADGNVYSRVRRLALSGDLPEAVFATNDELALMAMEVLREHGLSVPGDIGIVGMDGWPEAETSDPPLTTVRSPAWSVGRAAAEMLLNWPTDGSVPEDVIVVGELAVRESTRAVRPAAADASQEAQ